jgi:hypothetical protein
MHLILWPALIALAITLLRLAGELQGWPSALFNPAAGGGGALVGISWLPFLFGPWFAWKLARAGKAPRQPWAAAGLALLGIVICIGVFAAAQAVKAGLGLLLLAFLASLAASFLPWKAWPELGRVLLLYGLASRLPVVVVMLFAILGRWGTHYDVLPPDPPPALVAMGPVGQWFAIGVVPQLTIWLAQTVLIGVLVGAVVVALARPKPAVS